MGDFVRVVFVDCTEDLGRVLVARRLAVPENVSINFGNPTEADLVALCTGADVIFVEHTVIPKTVLDACPSIRAIVFMGTGAGTYVDLPDAASRGIIVRTTPGYGDRAVAEHAIALMFAAARRVAEMDRGIRAGVWSPLGGLQLEGQKIAVIGLGGIGSTMADIATALGMRVAGWNRSRKDHPCFEENLDEVLSGANIVTLHLSLNSETLGILDERRLRLPDRGFLLVNTARADLVDQAAMLRLLSEGQIGHAALDVFPEEPLPKGNPYVDAQSLTLTAHAAYMTDAAYEELWSRTVRVFTEIQDG